MPKAVSNIDTEFFEDVTALTLDIDAAVQALAASLDHPAQLQTLLAIHRHNRSIRGRVFAQRDKIKSARQPI
jgi:hypothetical protein